MKIYCHGERASVRVWGNRWTCDRCGEKLWRYDVPKRRNKPHPDDVKIIYVYPGAYGFRYTCRGWDNTVLYDSERFYKSRFQARQDLAKHFPGVRVSFEVR